MSNSLNGARSRGGQYHLTRGAGRDGETAGPPRSTVALAACLPGALRQGEVYERLGTAPPGVRAQPSRVTPESGLHAVVQAGRRAREAPVKVVLCASPECEGPPSFALLCKRALLTAVRVVPAPARPALALGARRGLLRG